MVFTWWARISVEGVLINSINLRTVEHSENGEVHVTGALLVLLILILIIVVSVLIVSADTGETEDLDTVLAFTDAVTEFTLFTEASDT